MAGAIGLSMSINVRPQGSRRLLLLAITILALVSVIFEASSQPMAIEDMLIGTLILCAWALGTFAAYAMVMAHAPRLPASRSLLLLRVFSSRTAASRLLDAVQANWRYIGPQYQIGGPDLAGFNVDCYEFLKFVSGRLAELFVFDQPTRQQLLARLDRQADREGRFRVCEVFCLDNAWRQTVLELMRMSDAILLDARAFRAERGGTAFEIENLAREQVLKRVVIAGDATTDWQYLESLIVRAGGDPADCACIDSGGRDGIKRCLHALHNVGARNAAIVAPTLQGP